MGNSCSNDPSTIVELHSNAPVVQIDAENDHVDTPCSNSPSTSIRAWEADEEEDEEPVALRVESTLKPPKKLRTFVSRRTVDNTGQLDDKWTMPSKSTHKRVLCKVPHILQEEDDLSVCACACIALHHFGHRLDQYYVKYLACGFEKDDDSQPPPILVSNHKWFIFLVDGLNKLSGYHWQMNTYECGDIDGPSGFHRGLRDIVASLDAKCPVIIDTLLYDGHSIIVAGYLRHLETNEPFPSFVCVDPGLPFPGRRLLSYSQLFSLWVSPKVEPPEKSNNIRLALFTCARGKNSLVEPVKPSRDIPVASQAEPQPQFKRPISSPASHYKKHHHKSNSQSKTQLISVHPPPNLQINITSVPSDSDDRNDTPRPVFGERRKKKKDGDAPKRKHKLKKLKHRKSPDESSNIAQLTPHNLELLQNANFEFSRKPVLGASRPPLLSIPTRMNEKFGLNGTNPPPSSPMLSVASSGYEAEVADATMAINLVTPKEPGVNEGNATPSYLGGEPLEFIAEDEDEDFDSET